jgi:hypothetical protein
VQNIHISNLKLRTKYNLELPFRTFFDVVCVERNGNGVEFVSTCSPTCLFLVSRVRQKV